MIHFTVADAAKACGGVLNNPAAADTCIGEIIIDSRKVGTGDLFVAYKGEKTDGHAYIPSALDKGAACCLAEHVPEGETRAVITVPDVQAALEQIAEACRRNIHCPIVGVTGSVGKTTGKEMVSAVLSMNGKVLKTDGNLNNHIGVPMTLSRIREDHDYAVVEMGISGFGEMDRLGRMAVPDIALYTVIGHAHLEFLRDLDGVLEAKTEMLRHMSENAWVVLNGDDEKQCGLQCLQNKIFYGFGENADVRAVNVEAGSNCMSCDILYHGRTLHAEIPAFGNHVVYAALEGACVGFLLGLSDEQIIEGIASYQIAGRRGQVTDTGYITVIDDSYNANPDSIKSSINSLAELPGRHVCVLADMLELGGDSPAMHEDVGRYAAEHGTDLLLCCGPISESFAKGAGEKGVYFHTRDELIAALPEYILPGDKVLVQASRGMRMELAAEALKELRPADERPCLLFDLDDTLLDFRKAEHTAVSDTFRTMGLEPTDAVTNRYSEINAECWQQLERGELTREEVLVSRFDRLFAELGVELSGYEARCMYEQKLQQGFFILPGATELLELLQPDYRLFIISNGTACVQDSRIEGTNLGHFFEEIYISERLGYNKPDIRFFENGIFKAKGFRKENSIVIGDSLTSDILGGIQAGIRTCRYNPKGKSSDGSIVPDYEVRSLEEIPELLKQIFTR